MRILLSALLVGSLLAAPAFAGHRHDNAATHVTPAGHHWQQGKGHGYRPQHVPPAVYWARPRAGVIVIHPRWRPHRYKQHRHPAWKDRRRHRGPHWRRHDYRRWR